MINVLLAQTEPISSMEFVEPAQLDTGQMLMEILVILVTNLVLNVVVELQMIVPNVILMMDSIFKMMEHVSDHVQILIMLMMNLENVKNVMPVVKLVLTNIMIAVYLAQKKITYMLMELV